MKKLWSMIGRQLFEHPQISKNRMVLKQLEKHNDNPSKEREVCHWIYFKTAEDRERFFTEVSVRGYAMQNEAFIDSSSDFPYLLKISKIDVADFQSINNYTMYLYETAIKHHGDYDGWETSIETE